MLSHVKKKEKKILFSLLFVQEFNIIVFSEYARINPIKRSDHIIFTHNHERKKIVTEKKKKDDQEKRIKTKQEGGFVLSRVFIPNYGVEYEVFSRRP